MAMSATERSRALREQRARGKFAPFGIEEWRDDRSGNSSPGGSRSKPVSMCGPFPWGSWRYRRPSLLGLAP